MDRKLGACDRWSVGGYVRFDLQSSEDGGTWKTQLAGAENV
jgi:hypothetical protein